jgi:hypothetical protein
MKARKKPLPQFKGQFKSQAPVVTVGPGVDRTIELHRDGKLKDADVASLLAAIQADAIHRGLVDALIPVKIITIIGEKLIGGSQWSNVQNVARREAAQRGWVSSAQVKADAEWRKNPRLSKYKMAELIEPDFRDLKDPPNVDTIRRKIHKPK